MKSLTTLSIAALIFGSFALSQDNPSAAERAPLLLVREIPLPNVGGRIDHFTFDAKRKRIIGATLGNNTVEVVDTFSGRDIHSITSAAATKEWFMWERWTSCSLLTEQMANLESTMEILSSH